VVARTDIVRRLFELTQAGAVEEVVTHYDEDAVVEVAFQRPALRGVDEVRSYLNRVTASPEVSSEVGDLRFEEHGDAVLVTGRLRLRDDTQRSLVDSPGAWVFRFRAEKVVEVRAFHDSAAARAAARGDAA
jgi:ketosteroid isomerase-like protein